MQCNKCLSTQTRVERSSKRAEEGNIVTIRTRECQKCGHRFMTREVIHPTRNVRELKTAS